MNNFKSGSGDLDFGKDDENKDSAENQLVDQEEAKKYDGTSKGTNHAETATQTADEVASETTEDESSTMETSDHPNKKYPYFVRRNNVGDERDSRLEIHVRKKVYAQEATFRANLAEQLDTDEISKTDAREFALLFAYQNPNQVAELMKEEGFGILD
jgi:hypothetical protein